MFKKTLILLLTFTIIQCKTQVEKNPFRLQTAQLTSDATAPAILAASQESCSVLIEKRIVYGLFALPMNDFTAEDLANIKRADSIKIKEIMTWGDIGLSVLGFMVSIISRTRVVEQCPSRHVVIGKEELAKYRAVEKKYEILLQNYELQKKDGEKTSAYRRQQPDSGR